MEKEPRPQETRDTDFEDPERAKRYNDFKISTRVRVSEIGRSFGASVRTAQAVTEHLFRATGGEASKVTDMEIEQEYQKYGYKKIG